MTTSKKKATKKVKYIAFGFGGDVLYTATGNTKKLAADQLTWDTDSIAGFIEVPIPAVTAADIAKVPVVKL